MKHLFISLCLLVSASAFAQDNACFDKAFVACVKQSLPADFVPTFGNRQFGAFYAHSLEYVEGNDYSTDSKVVISPLVTVVSDQVGMVQTKDGERQYEQRRNLDVQSPLNRKTDDMGLDIVVRNNNLVVGEDDLSYDMHADLQITAGLPFLMADRHMDHQCTTDAYGNEQCTPYVITYSNFRVVTPATYQPKLVLVNAATHQNSKYSINAEQYRNCLSQIH